MKTKNLRTAIAAGIFVVLAAGLIFGVSFGTLSGFGWDDFSVLCPLGALGTMIATKTWCLGVLSALGHVRLECLIAFVHSFVLRKSVKRLSRQNMMKC